MTEGKVVPFRGGGRKVKAYRLMLEFGFRELKCRRVLVVPATATLEDLHAMIQACNGWPDYCPHSFEASYKSKLRTFEPVCQVGEPEAGSQGTPLVPSNTTSIESVFDNTMFILYSYDRDGWVIEVKLLQEIEAPADSLPYCARGEGDCPPEGLRGEKCFVSFLDILNDYERIEHEPLSEWSRERGFEHFDVNACNERLAHWEDFETTPQDEDL